ncbi:sugar ABC transporter substrate-binding protein [Micromonospora sp. DR5-3]|uniref:ABC transporter substrate-binding protein n=1 Tax=unclassified Micromonospora TaxID=2617518 RepID=UPI0011DA4CAA|nr:MULTISPECIES: sugar ABC transporter substrate-binding protein [unclassified Micromonospora]MCW3814375.1 sugar ABC transporter substrate-binding protein [Micromonospora sp. DR5-3]TYC22435.1 sugar ABC transporter substrate-binding protein [Micromonospora sp. MP36]
MRMQRFSPGRRLVALAGVAALAATMFGCGAGSAESDGRVTIRLGYYAEAGGPADKTMRSLADEFMKANSGIKLELESAPYTDFFKRLRTQLAGGRGPDVWLSDGVLVQEYAGRNSLRDLSDFVKTINTDDYYGVDLNRDSDGHVYGFPQGAQTPVLFYNKKMFADAGVAEPTGDWTYDDLTAAAKKLTRDTNGDGKPDVWGMRVYSPGFTESWWPMIKAFGGDIVADGGHKVVIDSPQSRAGLDWMLNAMYTEKAGPDVVTTKALGSPHTMFASNRVAMQFGIYARTIPANAAKIDLGVAPMPKGPAGRGHVAIANSWVVNKAANQRKAEAAWKWITYFASEKPQTNWAGIGEAIPINKKVAASDVFLKPGTPPANRQAFLDALAEADDLGLNPVWTEYTTAVANQIDRALAKEKPVGDALTDAQRDAQQIIDRFYANK